jgi:hypothetical protein
MTGRDGSPLKAKTSGLCPIQHQSQSEESVFLIRKSSIGVSTNEG